MKKRRALTISLLALALLVCVASGLVMGGYWREQAGRELIRAIKANDTNRALDALRAHADPNVRDQGEKAPSLRDYLSKLWRQMRGMKSTTPNMGMTALRLAVQQDNIVVVEALLDRDAKNLSEEPQEREFTLEAVSASGKLTSRRVTWIEQPTPLLHITASHGNSAIVEALIRHGWDVNGRDEHNNTALFVASDFEMVKTLVACGADINAVNRIGDTPLFQAIWRNDPRSVQLLIDHQSKVNTQDKAGETPLWTAQGNAEIIKMLKKAGAKE
jgi:ankyrin repeat protein